MKPRILFWFGGPFIQFGLANLLQKKIDCELFGVADVGKKPQKFFKEQQLVDFQKIWYYRDEVLLDSIRFRDAFGHPKMILLVSMEEYWRFEFREYLAGFSKDYQNDEFVYIELLYINLKKPHDMRTIEVDFPYVISGNDVINQT